ncbi:MAG: trypsin-like peptidase domain-containing protein [Planctomycetes bacterium]|nr:trypsin-like peptidase domain-containing protein [Planctomycetota bacterium]
MAKLNAYGPSLIVLGTAAILLVAGPSVVRNLTYHQTKVRIQVAGQRLENSPMLQQLNQAYRDLATFVEPSVVHISTERVFRDRRGYQTRPAAGSGWIYDTEGHIVTNYHVIQDAVRIEVQLHTGDIWPAEIIGQDQFTDIAVIKIAPQQLHPALRAEAGNDVRQGDLVFAFGSPFDFRFSMSSGVVSGVGRSVGMIRDQLGRTGYENFIQVDAAINPGNSGGPLTDTHGRVIGMNTAIATGRRSGTFEEGQFAGIGLAIPIEMIEPVVDQLIETRVVQKGFLGVSVWDLNPRIVPRLKQRGFPGQGVLVTGLDAPGPAFEAGVGEWDIITHVNDDEIATVAKLRSVISSMLPGEVAQLRIWREDLQRDGGRMLTLDVTLDRFNTLRVGILPADQRRDRIEEFGIGKMSTSTRQLARNYGVRFIPGVLIEEIIPGSQLDGRIRSGSILVAIMDAPISNVEELFDRLSYFDVRNVRVTFLLPNGTRADVMLGVR